MLFQAITDFYASAHDALILNVFLVLYGSFRCTALRESEQAKRYH